MSISIGTTLGKLKMVGVSKNSITISGKSFSTTLGPKKLKYSITKGFKGVKISVCTFIGSKGYGLGLSFICSIYNIKGKKIGYVSFNIVSEVTYLTLALAAVTIAGVCVALPHVIPLAKKMVATFSLLTSPKKIIPILSSLYTLTNNVALRYA